MTRDELIKIINERKDKVGNFEEIKIEEVPKYSIARRHQYKASTKREILEKLDLGLYSNLEEIDSKIDTEYCLSFVEAISEVMILDNQDDIPEEFVIEFDAFVFSTNDNKPLTDRVILKDSKYYYRDHFDRKKEFTRYSNVFYKSGIVKYNEFVSEIKALGYEINYDSFNDLYNNIEPNSPLKVRINLRLSLDQISKNTNMI